MVYNSTFDVMLVAAVIIILIIIILFILRKKRIVTVPSITLALTPVTPPGQYDHGETVNVTGVTLLDVGPPAVPGAGDTVTLDLVDASGAKFAAVGTAQAGTDGSYAGSFVVPAAAAPGTATLTVTDGKTGATATTTFTLRRMKMF